MGSWECAFFVAIPTQNRISSRVTGTRELNQCPEVRTIISTKKANILTGIHREDEAFPELIRQSRLGSALANDIYAKDLIQFTLYIL